MEDVSIADDLVVPKPIFLRLYLLLDSKISQHKCLS